MSAARQAAAERATSSASAEATVKANTSTGMSLNVSLISYFVAVPHNTDNTAKPFSHNNIY